MGSKRFSDTSRRQFLFASLAGSSLVPVAGWTAAMASDEVVSNPDLFHEPARETPLFQEADVVVCGGGPAGVSAAIAAARAGAKVRLIEANGCLGGVWTSGLLTWVFDFDKPGLATELRDRLADRDAIRGTSKSSFVYEPDEMKRLLEALCVEAGVLFQLQTRLVSAYREERQLTTIVTESRSGRQAWQSPVFIDATGDGVLGALAGCSWELGNMGQSGVAKCACQPLTMNSLAVVKDVTQMHDVISFYQGDLNWHVEATKTFKAEIQRAGIDPSYGMPTIFHVRDNVVLLMLNHEYGIRPDDAPAMTEATVRARKEIFDIVHSLRRLGGIWEGLQVVATAEQIGIRDGKRIQGRYKVTKADLMTAARHEDAVCRVTFGVDIHAKSKQDNNELTIERGGVETFTPYDIPLRALIADEVDGLMMAGRCISGDFVAHASYRVTGNAVAMGEAAGAAAALAATTGRQPHEVDWNECKKVLDQFTNKTEQPNKS